MKIVVNGEQVGSNANTVQELLNELKIVQGHVAVEVNLSIIKKSDYDSCRLKDGDRIEIVNFVGGGNR